MNNTDMDSDVPAKSDLGYPQAVLYIPSIVVAAVLIVFLGVSFIRYHRRVLNKMGYIRDYVEQNLHVKRERIPGHHVVSLTKPRLTYDMTGSLVSNDQTNDLKFSAGHTLPEDEDSITIENEKNIYLKKPRTPKSYFDNDAYEEDISSNRFSRRGSFPQTNVRPIHELYEESDETMENQITNKVDNESESSISNPKSVEKVKVYNTGSTTTSIPQNGVEIPVTYLCETCQNHIKTNNPRRVSKMRLTSEDDRDVFLDTEDKKQPSPRDAENDDAFQRSPRPSTKKHTLIQEEEPKTRKKSINSRTFPDAKVRLGVFELEPR